MGVMGTSVTTMGATSMGRVRLRCRGPQRGPKLRTDLPSLLKKHCAQWLATTSPANAGREPTRCHLVLNLPRCRVCESAEGGGGPPAPPKAAHGKWGPT